MSLLLPFCQFLLHRLQTENLELLQRAVSEFLSAPPRFETIDSMVQLAFPLVAVLPVEHADADERARAAAILSRVQQQQAGDSNEFHELRAALAAKVELKNWDWLEQIFAEFCVGKDRCLRHFVAIQQQAIAIVPLRSAEALRLQALHTTVPSPVVTPSRPLASTYVGRSLGSSGKQVQRKKRGEIRPDDRRVVFEELLALEKRRPWDTVFDVSRIEYPFDETKHPDLAAELKRFWERHARAVWERMFWFYYGTPHEHTSRQEDRKNRQDAATRSFESRVMLRAYEAFGPAFFVDLDLRPQRHHWWWYRGPVIDILRMGIEPCLQYLRSKAFERFPDPPPGFELRYHHNHATGRTSFWAALAKYEEHRRATEELKHQRIATGA